MLSKYKPKNIIIVCKVKVIFASKYRLVRVSSHLLSWPLLTSFDFIVDIFWQIVRTNSSQSGLQLAQGITFSHFFSPAIQIFLYLAFGVSYLWPRDYNLELGYMICAIEHLQSHRGSGLLQPYDPRFTSLMSSL